VALFLVQNAKFGLLLQKSLLSMGMLHQSQVLQGILDLPHDIGTLWQFAAGMLLHCCLATTISESPLNAETDLSDMSQACKRMV